MTMGPDLALAGIKDFPEDTDRVWVPHHRIGQKIRRDNAELIEQLLQRRKAVHITGGRMAMRNNPPLILFYIHRDNQLNDRRLLATRSYDRPSFYLSNILAACFPLSSSLRATARTDRL